MKLNGKTYNLLLTGGDPSKVHDENEIIYKIKVIDVSNNNHTYNIKISLKLVRSLFEGIGASPQLIDKKLIIYHLNKKAFHIMTQCVYFLEGNRISLDFNKFKQRLSDQNGRNASINPKKKKLLPF